MGVRTAPEFFQRISEYLCTPSLQNPNITVAGESQAESYLAYLDDLTVATKGTWQEHVASLGRFLDRLIHHGFTLNLEKCCFLKTRVKLLGHTVSREGISATPDYVKKVADFTNFTTIKDVQAAYLGLSIFYRGYIRNFSQRTCNMRNSIEVAKLAKRTTLEDAWTPACEAERLDICTALQSAVDGPLAYPNYDRAFRIAVDGCMTPGGLEVTLEQEQADGSIRPVGSASRALTKQECKWDASRLEAAALIFGLRTFRWALSAKFKHVFVTDHHALKWLRGCVK